MNPLLLTYSERTATALCNSVWHGALLLGAVALALRLLPRLTAGARSLIWTAAFFLVTVLPFVPPQSAQTLQRAIDPSRVLHLNPAWSLAIAGVWLLLSLLRAAQLIRSALRLRKISAVAEPVAGALRTTVTTSLGIRRSAILCLSEGVARPSVLGFFAPRILVPRDLFPRLSASEVDQIVLHEMEHLRRGDDWRNLLQKLAVMLFPLNPALFWIERRLCFERELACDESVLAQTNAPKSYAACLVHLAEERSLGRHISLALGAWEHRSELGRRVHGILSNGTAAAGSTRFRAACTASLTASMVALAFALAQTPQFVSFHPAATAADIAAASPAPLPTQTGSQRPATQPRMINTMMRMPVAAPLPVRHMRARLPQAPRARLVLQQVPPAITSEPHVVLTAWTYSDGISTVRVQRIVYAVFEVASRAQTSSSETAQPLPDGLFLLQL